MRLSKRVVSILKESVLKSFGDVEVYLFGSRVDDSKKGGDIDLAIKTNLEKDAFKKNKYRFITELLKREFIYKIDVVDFDTKDKLLKSEIRKGNVKLF